VYELLRAAETPNNIGDKRKEAVDISALVASLDTASSKERQQVRKALRQLKREQTARLLVAIRSQAEETQRALEAETNQDERARLLEILGGNLDASQAFERMLLDDLTDLERARARSKPRKQLAPLPEPEKDANPKGMGTPEPTPHRPSRAGYVAPKRADKAVVKTYVSYEEKAKFKIIAQLLGKTEEKLMSEILLSFIEQQQKPDQVQATVAGAMERLQDAVERSGLPLRPPRLG
jgi:hypothetical protein